MLRKLTAQVCAREDLSEDQVEQAVGCLTQETVDVSEKADFLTALARKGESVPEILGFVRCLRQRAIVPDLGDLRSATEILDVVGTGGDRLSTFNISTTVAILVSAAGVLVAKHGNRASTSTIGSADVMEALGFNLELSPEESVQRLRTHGFAFFFAPRYHPAFRHIIPARKLCASRGQPTVFNYLGPLLNPALPTAMLVGVPRPQLCEPMARVLQASGVRRAIVACGEVTDEEANVRFLDEFSSLGPTTLAEFLQEKALSVSRFSPDHLPLQPAHLADLRGGDRAVNARIIHDVLNGVERGPKRDAVLLNAAAALFVAGRARDFSTGWDLAAETIDSGQARRKLEALIS